MENVCGAFRPSSLERFLHCNLHGVLPQKEKTAEQLNYLALRTSDHSRLEKEFFLDSERNCSEFFQETKKKCGKLFKERTMSMEIGGQTFSGTPDVFGYEKKNNTLHILDFKTGALTVYAREGDTPNRQLVAYALLVCHTLQSWKVERLSLSILNTQKDYVDTFLEENPTALLTALKEKTLKAIRLNVSERVFGSVGKHCFFCPSKDYCPLKRDYNHLKNYADQDTDALIFETKKRKGEMNNRETAIKSGQEVSELLTPLVKERIKRVWHSHERLPKKFLQELKPMSFSEATKKFGADEVEKHTDTFSYRYISSP